MKKQVILVTGCCGFIGSQFIQTLLFYTNYNIVGLDKLTYAGSIDNVKSLTPRFTFIKGDICNTELLEYLFKNYNITKIVNFAAESHVDRSIKNSDAFLNSNIFGVQKLLDVFRNNLKEESKFVQISTDEVYGTAVIPFREFDKLNPSNPYSASKAAAEHLVLAYANTYKIPFCITRSSNNYGPRQFPEKLVPVTIYNALHNKNIPVYGDGKQVRDWLYVEDNCNAILRVMEYGKDDIFNIAANNEMENIDVVKAILDFVKQNGFDTKSQIEYVIDRPGHDTRYSVSCYKIKALQQLWPYTEQDTRWKPVVLGTTGFNRTVQWYMNNEDWLLNAWNRKVQFA